MKLWEAYNDEAGISLAASSKKGILEKVKAIGGPWTISHIDIGKVNVAKIIQLIEGYGYVVDTLEDIDYDEPRVVF